MAQADSLTVPPNEGRLDSVQTDSVAADTAGAASRQPSFRIVPWHYNFPNDSRFVSGDSLMRWQNWPDWTHKRNRDPEIITYRLGTVGRSNAQLIGSHEPRHQALFWEDVPMHDPVSGTVNWNVLPLHKLESVYEDKRGIEHETHFRLKQYYVNEPLSRLIFDESKFNRRALEFWLTQSFNQKTNAEISYWDRRGGGGYSNSAFTGSQIFARVYHQTDNRQLWKIRFLTGNRSLGEPFGYVISNLENFGFNRFSATPRESRAGSETGFSTLALSYHRRARDTTRVTTENFRAGLFLDNHKRQVTYSADTTGYSIRSTGAFAHKWIDWNPIHLEGSVRYQLYSNSDAGESGLDLKNWNLLSAKGFSRLQPFKWWSMRGEIGYQQRDDGYGSFRYGAGTTLEFDGRVLLSAGGSRGTVIPTVQQLYWNSDEYRGSPDLNNESIEELHAEAEIQVFRTLTAGARGQLKQVRDGIMYDSSRTFVNVEKYASVSASGYMDFESTHFELSASATLHRYQDLTVSPAVSHFESERIWFKGSAYWKGYLFNRATYVKAGVSGMLSPQRYLADHYTTPLDHWQPASNDQLIPWFSRMDVDISARVRSIMFVLRFENVLDEVSQLGYFETANYPMPPRRFLFGVRAVFNN